MCVCIYTCTHRSIQAYLYIYLHTYNGKDVHVTYINTCTYIHTIAMKYIVHKQARRHYSYEIHSA